MACKCFDVSLMFGRFLTNCWHTHCSQVKEGSSKNIPQYPGGQKSAANTRNFRETVQREIMHGGSVSGGVDWSDALINFHDENPKGIYESATPLADPNHAVAVIGWGTKQVSGSEKFYWIVQNSHGVESGDRGFHYVDETVLFDVDVWEVVVPPKIVGRTDCKNGRTPVDGGKCACPAGFAGNRCERCPVCANGARANAGNCAENCVDTSIKGSMGCPSGFAGKLCDVKVAFDAAGTTLTLDTAASSEAYRNGDLVIMFLKSWVMLIESHHRGGQAEPSQAQAQANDRI